MSNKVKVAAVTGGGSGLGAAIAARLSKDGYRVAVLDNNAASARAQAALMPGGAGFFADVTDEKSLVDASEAIAEQLGDAPTLLINNAGIVRFGNIIEQSVEDFRRVLDVNLTGTYIATRVFAPAMMAKKTGSIINITSLNAVMASPDAGAYPSSKAGVVMLTQHLALALGPHGVRVNAVGPGFINAGMSAPIYRDEAVRNVRGASVPLGSLGEADDVANTVAFLASDQARYIHGQHIVVDGGVSISLKNHLPRKPPA